MTSKWPYQIIHPTAEGLPIVFLHGFLANKAEWKDVALQLTDNPSFLFELPGHGQHKLSDKLQCLDDVAMSLHAALQELNLRSFVLVGYSLGARLALTYALRYPNFLSALVLESCSPGISTEEERSSRRNKDSQWASIILKDGMPAFLEQWYRQPIFETICSDVKLFDELIQRRAQDQSAEELARVIVLFSPGREPEKWSRLKELNMPVALLSGERDEKFSDIVKQMQSHIKTAKAFFIKDAGHNIHLERQEAVVKVISQMLT